MGVGVDLGQGSRCRSGMGVGMGFMMRKRVWDPRWERGLGLHVVWGGGRSSPRTLWGGGRSRCEQ